MEPFASRYARNQDLIETFAKSLSEHVEEEIAKRHVSVSDAIHAALMATSIVCHAQLASAPNNERLSRDEFQLFLLAEFAEVNSLVSSAEVAIRREGLV
jgi:hypothetical protein